MIKKTIGVVRGTRESVIHFYEHFEKLNVRFIAGSFSPFFYESSKKKNFNFVNLLYHKSLLINPPGIINQYGNLSWIFMKNLKNNLEGCDIISLTDTYYFFNLQAVLIAKKNKIPIVTVIWTTIPHHITTWFPPYSYITKKVVEATDLFILRSHTALHFTDSLGIPRNKIKVIYKGIDLDKFKPNKKKKIDKEVKILFTGNLSKAKGLDDLIYVFLKLKEGIKNIKLIIAGDGEMKNEVENYKKNGLVDFRGFVSYEKLSELYRDADIYCAPSKYKKFLSLRVWEEYFSYALMEAQASGLPIISTKSGGISEEVDNKNSLIFPGDRKALYRELKELILNKEKRKYLGKINRKRAEKLFDAKIQAHKTEEAIIKLL